jgi:hypothetical protein
MIKFVLIIVNSIYYSCKQIIDNNYKKNKNNFFNKKIVNPLELVWSYWLGTWECAPL